MGFSDCRKSRITAENENYYLYFVFKIVFLYLLYFLNKM